MFTKLFLSSFIALCFLFTSVSFAQPVQGNVVVIQNSERDFPLDGSAAEFDSLTKEYNMNVLDKNDLLISYKVVRHWWGHNNRDFITIMEVKSWEDVIKANEKNSELFEAHWNTSDKQKAFNDAYDKYFTGEHSDEIYQAIE